MILHFLNFGGGLQFLHFRNPQNAPPPKSSSLRCVSQLAGGAPPANDVAGILHNKVIVSAIASAAIGQLTKPFASAILYGEKFDWKTCLHSGGFPSTHSSSVVATATCLAIERGFSDPIFGLAVIYAGLMMYDAQGVRREVGNHARVLNKFTPSTKLHSSSSTNDLVNSYPGESSPDSDITDHVLLEENGSSHKRPTRSLLLESEERMHVRSSVAVTDSNRGSERVESCLKETIGHTEIEVAAGAFLGLVVSLVVCPYL